MEGEQIAKTRMICPGCGETRMVGFDPALKRWNCDVCGWSWIWRAIGGRHAVTT